MCCSARILTAATGKHTNGSGALRLLTVNTGKGKHTVAVERFVFALSLQVKVTHHRSKEDGGVGLIFSLSFFNR